MPSLLLLCLCFCVSLYTFPVQQCRVLVTHIDACGLLVTAESKDFAKALVANRLGALAVVPGAPGGHSAVLELTVHMASVLLCANQRILIPLQNLALSTGNMRVSALASFYLEASC
jgi:zona occludens toxin (predicted ATPase)